MKHIYLIVLLLVFSVNAYAQSTFMPGYFIDNDGNRFNCLIRNYDRRVNPVQIEYKLTESSAVEVGNLADIKEFEILNTPHKYQRFTVNIDRSSNDVNNLTSSREPEFKEETLFLRVLVEGDASLYYYAERGGLHRFFFKMNNSAVEQLVYKRYNTEGQLGENESYKHQLRDHLTCLSVSEKETKDVSYSQRALVNLFTNYNTCAGANYTDYTLLKKKGKFGLTVTGGVNMASLETTQILLTKSGKEYNSYTHDMVVSPLVGIEAEYNFTFNNGRWYIFTEPTFQKFNYTSDFTYTARLESGYKFTAKGTIAVNYDHISLPLGMKYAVFATENSSIIVQGAGVLNFLVNKEDSYEGTKGFNRGQNLDFQDRKHFQTPSYSVGAGYKYKRRFSLEADYHLYKILVRTENWEFKFANSVSVALGYSLF